MARDPVKISRDLDDNSLTHEVYVGITDGTEQLLIDASGNANTVVNNAAGASAVNIQDGGNSITVDGTVAISGTVTVSATDLDIRDLVFATDKVDISGSTLAANSGVDIGDVTINNAAGAAAVNIQDGGNVISIDDGGGSITVDGTVTATNDSVLVDDSAFGIATDSVTGMGALADETASDSVDEGDIGLLRMTLDRKLLTRVDNAGGASAVNIQDGGNAITIDGTLTGITNDVNIADGGNSITVDGTVAATQSGTWNIGTVASITADVNIADGGNSITVDAVQLDIDDLSATSDNVAISDGTDTLAVNGDGSINVVVSGSSGTAIADYDAVAALAAAGSDNHDYTAAGGAFSPTSVSVSGESIGTFAILANAVAIATLRTSVENPNAVYEFPAGFSIADTQVLRVTRTNDSNKVHNFESTINGSQA